MATLSPSALSPCAMSPQSATSACSEPRKEPGFYHKGWRGESVERQPVGHFQDAIQAYQEGKDLKTVLQKLLEVGGDERSVTNPATGLTKYHTPTRPCKGVFRSSCTSNVATDEAFSRGLDTLRQLLLEAKNMSKQKGRDLIYASPEDLFRKLLCDVRERLRAIWELSFEDTISLFPSGTDAELMPALLGFLRANSSEDRGTGTFTIITAAGEVGSGTERAAQGKHFAKCLPSGRETKGCNISVFGSGEHGDITGANLFMRDSSGHLLSEQTRDELVEDAVQKAAEEKDSNGKHMFGCIVVHMVVGSKTGQCMPSEACMRNLENTYGSLILPVVDACQGRLGEGAIREYLDRDRMVLCTGSKFYGGPPFSGVCLASERTAHELETMITNPAIEQMLLNSSLREYISAPLMSDDLPRFRSLLPQDRNYGVLMRWTLALHGMEAFHAEVPRDARIQLASKWTQGMRNVILAKNSPLIQLLVDEDLEQPAKEDEQSTALRTIVAFHCRCNRGTPEAPASAMTMDELRHVQLLMATDLTVEYPNLSLLGPAKTRCFLGQPVDLSPDDPADVSSQSSGSRNVLRVAASAPLIVRANRDGLDDILAEDQAIIEKLALILGNWFIFQKKPPTA